MTERADVLTQVAKVWPLLFALSTLHLSLKCSCRPASTSACICSRFSSYAAISEPNPGSALYHIKFTVPQYPTTMLRLALLAGSGILFQQKLSCISTTLICCLTKIHGGLLSWPSSSSAELGCLPLPHHLLYRFTGCVLLSSEACSIKGQFLTFLSLLNDVSELLLKLGICKSSFQLDQQHCCCHHKLLTSPLHTFSIGLISQAELAFLQLLQFANLAIG